MTSDTALNAVINETHLSSRISNAPTLAAREGEETLQAKKIAEGLGGIVTKQGRVASFSEAKGGLGGNYIIAHGSTSVGKTNYEEENYNMYYGQVRRMQDQAREQATENGEFNPDKFEQKYSKNLKDLYSATNEIAQGKSEVNFGADAPVGFLKDRGEQVDPIRDRNEYDPNTEKLTTKDGRTYSFDAYTSGMSNNIKPDSNIRPESNREPEIDNSKSDFQQAPSVASSRQWTGSPKQHAPQQSNDITEMYKKDMAEDMQETSD